MHEKRWGIRSVSFVSTWKDGRSLRTGKKVEREVRTLRLLLMVHEVITIKANKFCASEANV